MGVVFSNSRGGDLILGRTSTGVQFRVASTGGATATVERRLGLSGPFDFDVHPTNLGHTFIAKEFERVFDSFRD